MWIQSPKPQTLLIKAILPVLPLTEKHILPNLIPLSGNGYGMVLKTAPMDPRGHCLVLWAPIFMILSHKSHSIIQMQRRKITKSSKFKINPKEYTSKSYGDELLQTETMP